MGLNKQFWDELAIESYKNIIKFKPQNPIFFNNLGLAYQRVGNDKKAIAAFRKAIRCDRNFPDAHYHLANALKNSGQREAAQKSFATYQKLCAATGLDTLIVDEQVERLMT